MTTIEGISGREISAIHNGIEYEFKIMSYENVDEYATIIVHDKTHNNHYISYGFIELNNHKITSKWKKTYDAYRDNYICTKDLVITIE